MRVSLLVSKLTFKRFAVAALSFSNLNVENAVTNSLDKASKNGATRDAREVIDIVHKELVDGQTKVRMLRDNPNLQEWSIHISKDMEVRRNEIRKLKEQGKTDEANNKQAELNQMLEQFDLALNIIEIGQEGATGLSVRPMDLASSKEFIEKMSNFRLRS